LLDGCKDPVVKAWVEKMLAAQNRPIADKKR
jgi:hypothetical protein